MPQALNQKRLSPAELAAGRFKIDIGFGASVFFLKFLWDWLAKIWVVAIFMGCAILAMVS